MEEHVCVLLLGGLALRNLKIRYFLSCFLCLGNCAMAQPGGPAQGAVERQVPHEQRRAELRQTLQSQRQPVQAPPRQATRRLSSHERQALRQQLREQPQQGAGRSSP